MKGTALKSTVPIFIVYYLFQSAKNLAIPASVSGCSNILQSTGYGIVPICAPALAASLEW